MMRMVPTNGVPVTLAECIASMLPVSGNDAAADFEKGFSEICGMPHCIATGSGRSALYAAFNALMILKPGRRKILLPALTCESVYFAATRAGLIPVLYDLIADSLAPDVSGIAVQADEETLCAVISPLFGMACNARAAADAIRKSGAFLVEDLAQGLGCHWEGFPSGTTGDIAVYSFGKSKHITTLKGGMVCTSSAEIDAALRTVTGTWAYPSVMETLKMRVMLCAYALVIRPFFFKLVTASGIPFADLAFSEEFPRRMAGAWQCRLGLRMLKKLPALHAARNRNAGYILTGLHGIPGIRLFKNSRRMDDNAFLRVPVYIPGREQRQQLVRRLISAGIWAGSSVYRPLYELTGDDPAGFPAAADIHDKIVLLPCHPYLRNKEILRIIRICHNG